MNVATPELSSIEEAPVKLSIEPYISESYARAEKDKLWAKVWQFACREEEIPHPGDYYTYDILDQSIIVVRQQNGEIAAHHNVCRHRGKRLTAGCGHVSHFTCGYHGWQWNLQGENIKVFNKEHWCGALDKLDLALPSVRVDRWGGYVFINLDPDCGPLDEFLQPLGDVIAPLDLAGMRYKWRKWLRYPANWKVVTEAFIEGYHAATTHPQSLLFGGGNTASAAEGLHARMWAQGVEGGGIGTAIGKADKYLPREIPYLGIKMSAETTWANYSDTFLEAAKQVSDTLPDSATAPWSIRIKPLGALYSHGNETGLLIRELRRLGELDLTLDFSALPALEAMDPAEGYLAWNGVLVPAGTPRAVVDRINAALNLALADPLVKERIKTAGLDAVGGTPEQFAKVGINWHLFPNQVILPNVTFALGFRVRPDGFNPDSCITEIYALERYPEGLEPTTSWEHAPDMLSPESWPLLLRQDFRQMNQIQEGMKSAVIPFMLPNPLQEAGVINLQRNLAAYMGAHAPEPIV